MTTTCPRCHRSLSSDEGGDAPFFCMYCGTSCGRTRHRSTPRSCGPGRFRRAMRPTPTTRPRSNPCRVKLAAIGCCGSWAGGMGTVYEAEGPPPATRRGQAALVAPGVESDLGGALSAGRPAGQPGRSPAVRVRALAADTDAGRPYIVMELMPGQTLKDVVDKRGRLPPGEAISAHPRRDRRAGRSPPRRHDPPRHEAVRGSRSQSSRAPVTRRRSPTRRTATPAPSSSTARSTQTLSPRSRRRRPKRSRHCETARC